MEFRPCGLEAVLIELGDSERHMLVENFRHHAPQYRIVPAAQTLLVYGNPQEIKDTIATFNLEGTCTRDKDTVVEIPVRYDGPDLERAAALANKSVEALIRWHQDGKWVADFGGFSPGFMYLTRDNEPIDFPRLETPRPRLEAGSVGLAGLFSGIYPQASPGGWNIIGHTDSVLWDIDRDAPSLITPGDRVTFRSVN
ncbi:MAG: carboxyltransferase domain-containing protein [Corynebacterium sp.]|nr:carboxyltransferase domain-containing protein [Corynebacterium sp.]